MTRPPRRYRAFKWGGQGAPGRLGYLRHLHKRAATYIDRILNGERPADLRVQAPTKYHLVVNLKTAKALGLEVAISLLARGEPVAVCIGR
jgi:hypothetical protein